MTAKKSFSLPEPSPVEAGGRVELRLENTNAGDGLVHFHARWFTEKSALEGSVTVGAETPPRVHIEAPEGLPEWLSAFTTTLVRTTARKANAEGTWPRRVTRWRASPAEKDQTEEPDS